MTIMPSEDALQLEKDRLDRVMQTGTYALGLAIELVMATARGYDQWSVLDEISALERGKRSTTKPATPFKRKHLFGDWHKHHTQAGYMPHNMLNEMIRDKTVDRELSPHIGKELTREVLGRLCHTLVIDNYLRRLKQGRLTGEWIVFSKRAGANHYLTLANHLEGDGVIARRVHD